MKLGRPSYRFLVVACFAAAGGALGLMATTFVYADGAAYLTNDPKACANCHIMQEQFDGWTRSSHRSVAVCNDCHAPHDFVGKYATKAKNGFFHSWYFTLGGFHEPIQITEGNRRITEGACRHCHAGVVDSIDAHPKGETLECIRCHRSVGHLH
jgi:cytochrome c nitrite reductase small subunit